MLGVIIGFSDFNNQLFSQNSLLVKLWKLWVILALLLYTVLTLNDRMHILRKLVETNEITEFSGWMIYYSLYVASCTASCIAFITAFRSRINVYKPWWNSLSRNAYLIYLTHYIIITWTQFSLLNLDSPAFVKFLIVFIVSLSASWGLSILLRRIRFIDKYL